MIISFTVIKDLPGAKSGDTIVLIDGKSNFGDSNSKIRGASIDGKYWFEYEMLKYTEYFSPNYK